MQNVFTDYRAWLAISLSALLGYLFNTFIFFTAGKLSFLLALPLAAVFFAGMVIQPRGFLVALLFLRPLLDNLLNLTRLNVDGQNVGIGAILNLAIISLAVFLAFYRSYFPGRHAVVKSWIIFLLVLLVVLFYSPFAGKAVRLYFDFLSYFAMLLLPFLLIQSKEDFLFWLKVLGASFVLPVLWADVDFMRGGHHFIDAGVRIMGSFTHPNILAFYLVLGFTVYFYMLKSKSLNLKPGLRMGMVLLMLDMLVLLVATKTRNAWIAGIAGFFIYGLLKDKKVLLILGITVLVCWSLPPIQQRVFNVLKDQDVTDFHGINSFEWRMRMWQSALPQIAQKPIQGYGLASFKPMSVDFSSVVSDRGMGAHNAYLELMFETGIFGLLSFLGLFLTSLALFLKNMRSAATSRQAQLWALMAGYIISYMIICSADNLSYYLVFNWYVWFFIGLVLSFRHQEEAGHA